MRRDKRMAADQSVFILTEPNVDILLEYGSGSYGDGGAHRRCWGRCWGAEQLRRCKQYSYKGLFGTVRSVTLGPSCQTKPTHAGSSSFRSSRPLVGTPILTGSMSR